MTIRIQVANLDKEKTVDVLAVDYTKGSSDSVIRERTTLQPGERREFYVHTLRDIRVEES